MSAEHIVKAASSYEEQLSIITQFANLSSRVNDLADKLDDGIKLIKVENDKK